MALPLHQPEREDLAVLLRGYLARWAPEAGLAWLDEKWAQIAGMTADRILFTAFSAVPRHLGKSRLTLTEDERVEAEAARPGWRPERWSCDQGGRVLLLLSLSPVEAEAFLQKVEALFDAGDVGELIALYQGLPLLPFPERYRARAAEGLRSNMTSVFEAVALHNPYPAEELGEEAWNQMILKAVFVGSPLYAVQGLEQRANPTLAQMLLDYARERWAARRRVTPELWRPVGPFTEGAMVEALAQVLGDSDPAQREAAALAIAQSPAPEARDLLLRHPDLAGAITDKRLTWDSFARDRLGAQTYFAPKPAREENRRCQIRSTSTRTFI